MKKKVLITGSTGFIGKNLCQFFKDKYQLLTPSHKQLDLLDIGKVEKYLKKNKPDVVIHVAFLGGARNFKAKESLVYLNLKMFINLTNNDKFFKKMIFLGSGAEYDKSNSLKKVKEREFGQNIPQDEYGFSKFLCSKLIENNKKIINLRLFGVYGKYENYQIRFISNAICKMLFNLPITINQNVYFDYLYIDDLIRIIDYFIKHRVKHHFYNTGRGERIDLRTLAQTILKISGKKLPIKIKKPGLNKEYSCNIARLRAEIPNFQYTSLEKSIKELIEYYRRILATITKKELYEKN